MTGRPDRTARRPWRRTRALVAWTCVVGAAGPWLAGRLGWGAVEAFASPWAFQWWLALAAAAGVAALVRAPRAAAVGAALAGWATLVVLPQLGWSMPFVDAPRAVASSGSPAPARPFRVVHANVLCHNRPTDMALEWLAALDADVIVLQEMTPAWVEAMERMRASFPSAVLEPRRTPAGIGVFCRHPIAHAVVLHPAGGFPAIEATLEVSALGADGASAHDAIARRIRLLAVHPWSPHSAESVAGRNACLAWLGDLAAEGAVPTIVVGDFNDTPWGDGYAAFASRAGLHAARSGLGRLPTWPDRIGRLDAVPAPAMIPIDHCFVSPSIGVAAFEVGPSIGSDHRPIVVDLLLP